MGDNYKLNIIQTIYEKINCNYEKNIEITPEDKLENILLQAKKVINISSVKTGSNHPIFYFEKCLVSKLLYERLFEINTGMITSDYREFLYDTCCMIKKTDYWPNCINEKIEIDLAKNPVLPFPWNMTRTIDNMVYIGDVYNNSFEYDPRNHYSFIIKPIGITMVYNGNHSITSGIVKAEGKIISTEVRDISDNYERFYFDGVHIRNKESGKIIRKVKNFESGVLFEIGRLIMANNIEFK